MLKKILVASTLCLTLAAAGSAFAADSAPAPGAKLAPTPAAAPSAPVTKMDKILRPSPCIVPTLRLLHPGMIQVLGSRLTLTDDQKTKVLDLLNKSETDLQPKIQAQIQATQDYATLLSKQNATQAELLSAASKAMKAETDLVEARIGVLIAVRGMLTSEQNKALSEMLDQYTMPWHALTGAAPVPPAPPVPPTNAK